MALFEEQELRKAAQSSCFIGDCLCSDSIVHLGPVMMASKDLDKEMAEGTPFGLKLREIAKKVEALM